MNTICYMYFNTISQLFVITDNFLRKQERFCSSGAIAFYSNLCFLGGA